MIPAFFPLFTTTMAFPRHPVSPMSKLCAPVVKSKNFRHRRFGFQNIPVAGGGYLRLFPYRITRWAIRHLNEAERQPAMVYLHPWEIDPDQPRIVAPWRSRFRHYQNLKSTEAKCLKLLDDFSSGKPKETEEVLAQGFVQ